jgi:hypothetical protein
MQNVVHSKIDLDLRRLGVQESMVCQTFKLREAELFEGTPQVWHQLPLPGECRVPSMLCSDELIFLYDLAKRHCSGRGVIVDCGPLAGSSTWAFASGANRATPIHVYDLWSSCPGWEEYFPDRRFQAGDDVLPVFLSNLKEFGRTFATHKGDLGRAAMVGRTDPWIHVALMMVRDCFEWVDSPSGGTVCARLIKPMPHRLLPADYYSSLPSESANELIRQAADVCVGRERLCVLLAGATLFALRHQRGRAAQICDEVSRHSDYDPAFVGPDLELVNSLLA